MFKEQVKSVTARIRLTLHTDDRFFGPGICELMEKIRETGSIQAAAAEMEMSYTKAWKIIKRAENEMGVSLVKRMSGGKNGGSSILTPAGIEAVRAYREMEAKLAETAAGLLNAYRDLFTPTVPETPGRSGSAGSAAE